MKSVIFVGHGSKLSRGNEAFISFIETLFAKFDTPIKGYAFLENAEPSVFQAVNAAMEAGASEVTVVPVFLLPGVHANYDIPEALELLKGHHPNLVFRYGEAIGSHKVMVDVLIARLKEKGHKQEDVILVAHGSRLLDSAVELEKLAAILRERIETHVQVAYFTGDPSYQEVLALSKSSAFVLPYLLFSGGLLGKLKSTVKDSQVCEPIGFDPRLHEVLLEKMTKAKVMT